MKVRSADAGLTQAASAGQAEEIAAQRARALAGDAPTDRADLSRLGALLATLQGLEQQDPARYQRAVTALSSRLDEAAAAQGDGGGELLEALARKFRQSGGAPAPRSAAAAGYARAGVVEETGALEDLVEASLRESGAP